MLVRPFLDLFQLSLLTADPNGSLPALAIFMIALHHVSPVEIERIGKTLYNAQVIGSVCNHSTYYIRNCMLLLVAPVTNQVTTTMVAVVVEQAQDGMAAGCR